MRIEPEGQFECDDMHDKLSTISWIIPTSLAQADVRGSDVRLSLKDAHMKTPVLPDTAGPLPRVKNAVASLSRRALWWDSARSLRHRREAGASIPGTIS